MNEIGNMLRRASDRDRARYAMDPLGDNSPLLRERVAALEHLLSVERDASVRVRAECELLREANAHLVKATFGAEDQKEVAESVNRRQKIFLSMLAHELHNPIAAILTANNFMQSVGMLNPRAEKMAAIVGRQASHLRRLVDDLLDMARISTGKVSLKTARESLHDVLDSAVELSMPVLAERQQQVVCDLPPAPLAIDGDMVRLTQLFSNLLINASKFSAPQQSVLVSARVHGGELSVSVRDQGIGIALQDQASIFDLFTQAHDHIEHGVTAGLGIGLALVKQIAELHGGSVGVTSGGAGCGSEFTVILPLPLPLPGSPP